MIFLYSISGKANIYFWCSLSQRTDQIKVQDNDNNFSREPLRNEIELASCTLFCEALSLNFDSALRQLCVFSKPELRKNSELFFRPFSLVPADVSNFHD